MAGSVDIGTVASGTVKTRRSDSNAVGINGSWASRLAKSWQLWIIAAPAIIYLIIFRYYPMYGAQLAFREYDPLEGILRSPWVGFKHFIAFFNSYMFARVVSNTILISVYALVVSFPFPIILALLINEAESYRFKKTVQMVTYMPYFISTLVMVTIVVEALHPRIGVITLAIRAFGGSAENILGDAELFRTIFVFSGLPGLDIRNI